MAGSPMWKVYDNQGNYEASTKHAEVAGALVGFLGEGATIRFRHGKTVWKEGKENQPANESFDFVAQTCMARAFRN